MRFRAKPTFLFLVSALPGAVAAGQSPPAAGARAGEVRSQEIVATSQRLALVVETRAAELPAGRVELAWDGAPATARTETWTLANAAQAGVRLIGLTAPPAGAAENWLAGLVGRRVRVERREGGSVEAEVVAVNGPTAAEMLFREGDDLVYGEPGARISVPGAGRGGAGGARITLSLSSDRAGSRELTSRYLVGGLGWEANYALALSPDEKSGRLEGAFALDNDTGAELAPTRLRLLAGQLRLASSPGQPLVAYRATRAAAESVGIESAPASESRIFEVPSPGRLPRGRRTFSFLHGEVAVEKRYVLAIAFWPGQGAEDQRVPIGVRYRVAAARLAAALPAGVVRVYAGGGLFTGEDRIEQTPERTDFEIETSEAFDLVGRRRSVRQQQLSPGVSEAEEEVVIRSRKKESVTVVVRASFPGDWEILESSVASRRTSASTAEFSVAVPAGAEATLKWRVRYRIPQ
jgi:hypothetical protein